MEIAMMKMWKQWVLVLVLCVGLTACGGKNFPPPRVIEQAIALQVEHVQVPLSQQLKLKPPALKDIRISHVRLTEQSPLEIDRVLGYHLKGTYDLTLKQVGRQARQQQNPFDLYIQQQVEGKTKVWNLAQPDPESSAASPVWITRSISMP
jgi:hypothetical protein